MEDYLYHDNEWIFKIKIVMVWQIIFLMQTD